MRKGSGWGGGGGRPKNDGNDQMNKTKQSLWSFDNEMFVNCLPGAAWKPGANQGNPQEYEILNEL